MKKHLIAAAVAAAVAVPAMAQNVSLYGRLDAGYNSLDIKPNEALPQFASQPKSGSNSGGIGSTATGKSAAIAFGVDQTALWGLRGTEDLGNGMKANFVIESSLGGGNTTVATGAAASLNSASGQSISGSGGSTIGNRLTYAGLTFASGTELRVGYQSSFIRDVTVGFAADGATNITGNALSLALAPRHNNISLTQKMGAVTLGAAVSKQTTNTNAAAADDEEIGSGYALIARYDDGPLSAAVAYMQTENLSQAAASANDRQSISAGASYNFGPAALYAQYGSLENEKGTAVNQPEATLYNIGIRVPLGNVNLFASFSSGDNRNSAVDYEGDVRGYNLGARYSLSKRTNAFAILGKLEIDTAANARTEAKQMGVGITHSF